MGRTAEDQDFLRQIQNNGWHFALFFLGRLKPFFSFWKRKKRMGSKTLPVCAERRQPPLGKGAFEWTESSVPAGVKVNFKSCKRADEYPRGAGRICNAPSSRTAALGIGPYNHDRKCGTRSKKRADRVVRPDKRCGVNRKSGQGRPPLQEVRRKPEERAGRLSLQHKNAAIQHGWLRFDLGCYSPFSLSKKLLRLGCEASPVASSSLRSSSFCSLVSFVGVSTTTVTNWSPRVL